LPVQGIRIILMFPGYLRRMEPARSAAVYPQKLQQKAIITGSKAFIPFSPSLILDKQARSHSASFCEAINLD